MIKARPMGTRVILKKFEDKKEETKVGSLILPESTKKRNDLYEVMAVGDQVFSFHPGDLIMLDRYAAHPIHIDGDDLFVVKLEEISLIYSRNEEFIDQSKTKYIDANDPQG